MAVVRDLSGNGAAQDIMEPGIARGTRTIAPVTLKAANDAITVDADGFGCFAFQTIVLGTMNFVVEATINGVDWFAVAFQSANAISASPNTSIAATNQALYFAQACYPKMRVRATAATGAGAVVFVYLTDDVVETLPLSSSTSVIPVPNATGKETVGKIQSTASTNATLLKSTASGLHSYTFCNTSAAFKFVHFHNKATAPVPGTDSPLFTLALPPNSIIAWNDPVGVAFSTGLGYSITGATGNLDATALGVADEVVGFIGYL